jgi:colicin import membrane protein
MKFCLVVSLVVLANARLNQPGDSQQLAVSGADANPEVDAWHAAEKAKIEADCNEMLMKLDREKRAKLQAIVDQKQRELDAELARLADAQKKAEADMAELRKQKGEAEAEAAKVPPAKAKISPAEDEVAHWRAEVERLRRLIAEKQACLDELARAKAELEDAKRALADAKRRLADAEARAAAQKDKEQIEAGHVRGEEADVSDANDVLDRAKARLDALLRRLAKAEADLKEHDEATPPSYR